MLYKLNKNGDIYIFLGYDNELFKHPTTREWVKTVTYQSTKDNKIYRRTEEDFNNNFSIIQHLDL